MAPINVLVSLTKVVSLSKAGFQKISSVSPDIKITDATNILTAEENGEPGAEDKLNALLADTEIYLAHHPPKNLIKRAPKLKWIQISTAGAERFLIPEILNSPVILTKGGGNWNATSVSEFTLGLILMLAKLAPLRVESKQKKEWNRAPGSVLFSKTVGIVGLGRIGREVARLSKAFGMRVLATRRSAKEVGRARYVDILFPAAELPQLLAESDFVTINCAATPETVNLIGEKELHAMKPSAYLINVSRGDVVNQEALIHALNDHWIAGAALDCAVPEPLPASSKLWDVPNLIISAHVAGNGQGFPETVRWELFADNLQRYLSGRRLENLLDKKKGY